MSTPLFLEFAIDSLRGERGCDGSHNRAFSAGTRDAWRSRRGTSGQPAGKNKIQRCPLRRSFPDAHSTGTTISFGRTMFRRLRAATSMVRGSVRNFSISKRNDWLVLRNPSTSVCMRTYCSEAKDILVRVRIVTPTQMANVPRIIIPKITHAGINPPRRLTSARVPIISREISLTDANGEATRGATRCARIRSSTQYVSMTLLKEHLHVFC